MKSIELNDIIKLKVTIKKWNCHHIPSGLVSSSERESAIAWSSSSSWLCNGPSWTKMSTYNNQCYCIGKTFDMIYQSMYCVGE